MTRRKKESRAGGVRRTPPEFDADVRVEVRGLKALVEFSRALGGPAKAAFSANENFAQRTALFMWDRGAGGWLELAFMHDTHVAVVGTAPELLEAVRYCRRAGVPCEHREEVTPYGRLNELVAAIMEPGGSGQKH